MRRCLKVRANCSSSSRSLGSSLMCAPALRLDGIEEDMPLLEAEEGPDDIAPTELLPGPTMELLPLLPLAPTPSLLLSL